jgi:hypothetical protein
MHLRAMPHEHRRKPEVRPRRLLVVSAVAVLLVAAASGLEANLERLKSMPQAERNRLLDNLRNFDLTLTPEQRAAILSLDRQITEASTEQRGIFRCVLQRYHAWLNTLPEQRQDELSSKPPGERMALIRKWLADFPVPTAGTPPWLQVMEPAEYNPFEVASAYRIWQALSERDRAALLQITAEPHRRQVLFQKGSHHKPAIPHETIVASFDEEHWTAELRDLWSKLRTGLQLEDAARNKGGEVAKKKVEMIRAEVVRRQAINLFVGRTPVRAVEPERLVRFIAALPPWVAASFDALAPDEARRRLVFAYRQVFPYPDEIGVAHKAAAGRAPAAHKPSPSAKAGHKAKGDDDGGSPF